MSDKYFDLSGWITDDDKKWHYYNQSQKALCGYKPKELISMEYPSDIKDLCKKCKNKVLKIKGDT